METLKIFGERLRALRDERHLRQADMAEVLQITLVHYQRMEYGKVNVPSLTLCFLADYFSVTTDYLLGRSAERNGMMLSAEDLPNPEKMKDNVYHGSGRPTRNNGRSSNSRSELAAPSGQGPR